MSLTEKTTSDVEATERVVEKLFDWVKKRDFKGIDPYDALNSPLTPLLSLGTRLGRIVLTQLARRSPINLRPLLRIRPGANPKALGLFLEGVVKLARRTTNSNDADLWLQVARDLARRLYELRSPNVSGSAWGYNFPWQNRFQLLPRFTPTIVNTSFIALALLDYYDLTRDEQALEVALSSRNFILNDLNRQNDAQNDAFCFSYTPLDENFVHNANMLGASLLARLAISYGASEAHEPALEALRYSMKRQREDGSWFYAEREEQRWIDSFHTGFNLESLRRALKLGVANEYESAYRRGVEFYADNFFLADGTPKYYADRLYLVDVHAPAEAVYFFSGERDEKSAGLVARVLEWTLKNLYNNRSGAFYFRKTPYGTIKTPYMRWSQAWAFRALTEYLLNKTS